MAEVAEGYFKGSQVGVLQAVHCDHPTKAPCHLQVTVLRVFNRIMGDAEFQKSPAGHEARRWGVSVDCCLALLTVIWHALDTCLQTCHLSITVRPAVIGCSLQQDFRHETTQRCTAIAGCAVCLQ